MIKEWVGGSFKNIFARYNIALHHITAYTSCIIYLYVLTMFLILFHFSHEKLIYGSNHLQNQIDTTLN